MSSRGDERLLERLEALAEVSLEIFDDYLLIGIYIYPACMVTGLLVRYVLCLFMASLEISGRSQGRACCGNGLSGLAWDASLHVEPLPCGR